MRTRRRFVIAGCLLTGALTAGGCSAGTLQLGTNAFPSFTERYHQFPTCNELLSWTQETLRPLVTPWGIGDQWDNVLPVADGRILAEPAFDQAEVATGSTGTVNTDTNTQEVGVDEADVVEHDGRYVYSVVGERLRVVDTKSRRETYRFALPGTDHRLVLSERADAHTLVVASRDWRSGEPATILHRFAASGGTLQYHGSDHLEGDLVAVRAVGDRLHAVLRSRPVNRLDFVHPLTDAESSRQAALAANLAAVDAMTVEQIVPRVYTQGDMGQIGALRPALDCDRIGTPGQFSGHGLTWIATIDLDTIEKAAEGDAAVIADAGNVYASSGSLYVTTMKVDLPVGEVTPIRPPATRTAVHRFELDDRVSYTGSGEVPGRALSSYSISEHDGHLRIATTTDGGGFGQDMMSGIRILRIDGDELLQVGEIDGLGRGETIQGVRFSGELAFVVTFRQVDPLYTVDLVDPTRPRLLGELKIPGFSTWLLPLGDGRLLAYGQSGTEDGALTGVQWSLFDVSDLTAPRLVDTAAAGTWSEALGEPLALMIEPASGLIAAPGETYRTWDPVSGQAVAGAGNDGPFAWFGRIDDEAIRETARIPSDLPVRRIVVISGNLTIVDAVGTVTLFDGLPTDDGIPASVAI